jgi:hypothetical protein
MENNNLNNNDDDKTVFLSSSNNTNKQNLDKTTINMENSNNQSKADITQIQDTGKSDQGPKPPTPPISKVESKGGKISGGAFAAGVVGTAVAGAALGATFSEEIENVLDGNGLSAPDSTTQATEVKPEVQSNPTEPIVTAVPVIDPQIDPFGPEDLIACGGEEIVPDPNIVDPTVVVPDPFDPNGSDGGTVPDPNLVDPTVVVPDPFDPNGSDGGTVPDPFDPNASTVAVSTENYDNIDWASFNDAPATIEDNAYGQELAGTDFDNLNNTGGDLDQNLFDPGNEETNNEFL